MFGSVFALAPNRLANKFEIFALILEYKIAKQMTRANCEGAKNIKLDLVSRAR